MGGGVHPAMPVNGDQLYSRVLCWACGLNFKDIFPSDQTCACYEGIICIQSDTTCGLKDQDPFISSSTACQCGMPQFLLNQACKVCPIKLGCDLGTKLGDKCAKPLVVCCAKQIV